MLFKRRKQPPIKSRNELNIEEAFDFVEKKKKIRPTQLSEEEKLLRDMENI